MRDLRSIFMPDTRSRGAVYIGLTFHVSAHSSFVVPIFEFHTSTDAGGFMWMLARVFTMSLIFSSGSCTPSPSICPWNLHFVP